jgi:hypothetical protein
LALKRRGSYNKPNRELAKSEIRRLVIDEGYTYREVMDALKLPERTFQRYFSDAFIAEREQLATKLTDDVVLSQLAILEGRISRRYRSLLAMCNDKTVDPVARIKANDTAVAMAIHVYNIYCDAAVEILKDRANRFSRDRAKAEAAQKPKRQLDVMMLPSQNEIEEEYDESEEEEDGEEDERTN